MCSLHANTTFRASTFTRKFEMDTIRGIRSFSEGSMQKQRHVTNSMNPLGWPVSTICTATYTVDTCYMLSRRAGGKMMLSHQVSTEMLLRHRMQKDSGRYGMERDVTYGRNVQRTWSSPKNFDAATPALTWDVYKAVVFPPSHLFPFISICWHYSPRNEKSGKMTENNGESLKVRNGSSLPCKGFSRENFAEIKRRSMRKSAIE